MSDINLLRHILATLAYRCSRAVDGSPAEFGAFRASPKTRTPCEILAHMGDLFDWALTMLDGGWKWQNSTPLSWEDECERFFRTLKQFDTAVASGQPIKTDLTKIFSGPIADALTHTGQLATLRRLAGCPMKGESYARADIVIGRIGLEQTPANPQFEFD
jgi:hypothetical protein